MRFESEAVAAFSPALAVLGLFAVLSFSVAQRSRELGMRHGAGRATRRRDPMGLRSGLALAGIGVLIDLHSRWRSLHHAARRTAEDIRGHA